MTNKAYFAQSSLLKLRTLIIGFGPSGRLSKCYRSRRRSRTFMCHQTGPIIAGSLNGIHGCNPAWNRPADAEGWDHRQLSTRRASRHRGHAGRGTAKMEARARTATGEERAAVGKGAGVLAA